MIRRFNYTSRKRINKKDVSIRLDRSNGKCSFIANLEKLEKYGLPKDAMVFIEAYRQTYYKRFSFGTLGSISPPDCTIADFGNPEGILFRVKVTSNGEEHILLAEADKIPLCKEEDLDGNKQSLLTVKPEDIGDLVYRVDFSGPQPLLLINSDIGDLHALSRSPLFSTIVYPSVLREILTKILLIDKHEYDEISDDWKSRWIKFATTARGLGELPPPEDNEGREDWIEEAVNAFAKRHKMKEKFIEYWNNGGE